MLRCLYQIFTWVIFYHFSHISVAAAQQFYITGTTFSDSASPLPFVKIILHSNKMLYNSGAGGDFGIPSSFKTDTLSCWAEGYDTTRQAVFQGRKNTILLKPTQETINREKERGRLSNLIPNMEKEEEWYTPNNGETYPALIENQLVNANSFPVTGFSPHSNKASYANIRRFIQNKQVVNPNAVRVEEVINYFSISCTAPPAPGETFSVETRVTDCPWNPSGKMLFVNALARSIDFEAVPPANLVFLIDNSGSMDTPNRMPLLKSAFFHAGKIVERSG